MRPPRRHGKLGAIWAVLAGIVVVLGVVVAGIVIYLADVAGSDDGSHTGSPSTGTVAVPVVDPVAPTAPGTGPATLTATGDDETTTVDDVTLEPSGAPTAALVAIGADAGMRALPPTMVALPGGTFVMGCTAETARTERTACRQEGDPADCPQEVFDMEASAPATTTVGPFAIDRTEVRNELFARWLTSVRNRSVERHTIDDAPIDVVMRGSTMIAAVWAPGLDDHIGLVVEGDRIVARPGFERRPVVFVSWSGADRYCRARSRTLPTEAQWALAAGGGVRRFIVGNEPPGCDAVVRGRYEQGPCGGAPRRPENVGSTAGDVTPEGIRDLAGNVAEWVRDDFPLSVDEECGAPGQPTCRLIRGGEWESLLDRLRARSRNVAAQGTMERTLGFRCAQTL